MFSSFDVFKMIGSYTEYYSTFITLDLFQASTDSGGGTRETPLFSCDEAKHLRLYTTLIRMNYASKSAQNMGYSAHNNNKTRVSNN